MERIPEQEERAQSMHLSLLNFQTLDPTIPLPLSPVQSHVDGLVGGFVQQATDWRSLAAMMVGGMAYRIGRIGSLTVGTGGLVSAGVGLGTEIVSFEISHRSLASLVGENHSNPNLWRWKGNGGIRQGLLSSLIAFGSLKGAGRLAQGENIVVQHMLQDSVMVLGHQVSASFGITDRPQGTLAEQFLHAEATNLQLGAGMSLAHSFAPGIQGLERGLGLSLRSRSVGVQNFDPLRIGPQPALAGNGKGCESSAPRPMEAIRPHPLFMSKIDSELSSAAAMESSPIPIEERSAAFIRKIQEELPGLHREPSTMLQLLENYLRRLRILRLYASLPNEPSPTVLYPMAGVDVIPSLFFQRVIGVDPWVDFPHAPSDPTYFREQGLIVGRLDPQSAGEGFERKLEEIYEAAAQGPEHHWALGKDAFDGVLAGELLRRTPTPHFVFLKGTPYLDLFYNFSDPRSRNTPQDLRSVEDAALWLADYYSAPGDNIILWDGSPLIRSHLVKSGRYEPIEMGFLAPEEWTRLTGTPQWADVRVEPILNPDAGLNLRLTDSMEILKRVR